MQTQRQKKIDTIVKYCNDASTAFIEENYPKALLCLDLANTLALKEADAISLIKIGQTFDRYFDHILNAAFRLFQENDLEKLKEVKKLAELLIKQKLNINPLISNSLKELIKFIDATSNKSSDQAKAYKKFLDGRKHFVRFTFEEDNWCFQKAIRCYLAAIEICKGSAPAFFYINLAQAYKMYQFAVHHYVTLAKTPTVDYHEEMLLEKKEAGVRAKFYQKKTEFFGLQSLCNQHLLTIELLFNSLLNNAEGLTQLSLKMLDCADWVRKINDHLLDSEINTDLNQELNFIKENLKFANKAFAIFPHPSVLKRLVFKTYDFVIHSYVKESDLERIKQLRLLVNYCEQLIQSGDLVYRLIKIIGLVNLGKNDEAIDIFLKSIWYDISQEEGDHALPRQFRESVLDHVLLALVNKFSTLTDIQSFVHAQTYSTIRKKCAQGKFNETIYLLDHMNLVASPTLREFDCGFVIWVDLQFLKKPTLSVHHFILYLNIVLVRLKAQHKETPANINDLHCIETITKKLATMKTTQQEKKELDNLMKEIKPFLPVVHPVEKKDLGFIYDPSPSFTTIFKLFNDKLSAGQYDEAKSQYKKLITRIRNKLDLLVVYDNESKKPNTLPTHNSNTKEKLRKRISDKKSKPNSQNNDFIDLQDFINSINSHLKIQELNKVDEHFLKLLSAIQNLRINKITPKDCAALEELLLIYYSEKLNQQVQLRLVKPNNSVAELKSNKADEKQANLGEPKLTRKQQYQKEFEALIHIQKRLKIEKNQRKQKFKAKVKKSSSITVQKELKVEEVKVVSSEPSLAPAKTVTEPNFKEDPKVSPILKYLELFKEHKGVAYIVGGFVNELLHPKNLNTDVDIVFGVPPDQNPLEVVKKVFPNALKITNYGNFYKVIIDANIQFDLWHSEVLAHPKLSEAEALVIDARGVEAKESIAILDKNQISLDERKKFHEVHGRDFTMNAIYLGADGKPRYPIDTSKNDLTRNHLRSINESVATFNKFPLRVLRAVHTSTKRKIDLPKNMRTIFEEKISQERFNHLIENDAGRVNAWIEKLLLTGNGQNNFAQLRKLKIFHKLFPNFDQQLSEHPQVLTFINRSLQLTDEMAKKANNQLKAWQAKASLEAKTLPPKPHIQWPSLERIYVTWIYAMFVMAERKPVPTAMFSALNLTFDEILMAKKLNYARKLSRDIKAQDILGVTHNLFKTKFEKSNDQRIESMIMNVKAEWAGFFEPIRADCGWRRAGAQQEQWPVFVMGQRDSQQQHLSLQGARMYPVQTSSNNQLVAQASPAKKAII